ncbi:hypothetical protein IKE79_00205 [Candidatus Saccharibacteria bacterium]|nr:hypothetical protein [Candidatus Saccharibacteria bacterium]
MKETQKKVLGCFGLGLVAAVTFVAATLPVPGASATTSVTDTIEVRVVGSTPNVTVSGITNGAVLTDPNQEIKVDYENIDELHVQLKWEDMDGNIHVCPVADLGDLGGAAGSLDKPLDLLNLGNGCGGYGDYTLRVYGKWGDGVEKEDFVHFSYQPTVINADEDDYPEIIVDEDNPELDHVQVKITKDGIIIWDKIYGRPIPNPIDDLPVDELEPGTYTVTSIAYDAGGNELYNPYERELIIEAPEVPSTGAPDTGGLFQNLNISKEDYLITGLLVFFVFGVVAFGIIIRSRSKSTTSRKRK